MGGKQSTHRHHEQQQEEQRSGGSSSPKPKPEATGETAAAAAAAPPPVVVPEKVDVIISSTTSDKDMSLAKTIKDALEAKSIKAYIHSEAGQEGAKTAGTAVVNCKHLVYIASKEAAMNNIGQDLISLAYISNKRIVVAAEEKKDVLQKEFIIGMRMTLHQLKWTVFDEDTSDKLESFTKEIQEQASQAEPAADPVASLDSALMKRRGGRLNTKLRQQSTVQNFGTTEQTHINTFWERNFAEEEEVAWYKFQRAFLDDYEADLKGLVGEENIPWLLDMLQNDVFEGMDKITKEHFMQVRGESAEKNAFWSVVSQIAVEKFNMKEVFNMNSSVRLAAIEKLGTFQSPAVIEALMSLLDDRDPNVRAVAAICLGRTGTTEERVVERLIELLKDGDRIVRQSACLSLGAMKAVKAIPHIGNIWRNDFISVVRNAARTALENMKIPEAQEVLSVTKVLEDEIAALEGNQAAV